MNWWLLFLAIPSFFLWATLHELVHVISVPDKNWWKIYPYPHMRYGKFFFAYAEWETFRRLDSFEKGRIAFAPTSLDLAAMPFLMLAWLFDDGLQLAWVIIWGGAWVDFVVGSIGYSETSDLKAYYEYLGKLGSIWTERIIRLLFATAVAVATVSPFIWNHEWLN